MKKIKYILCGISLLLCMVVHAQEIFIRISNPNIEGESSIKGHENEIQALRYAQEATSCDTQNPGSGQGICKVKTSSFAFDLPMNQAVIGLKGVMYKNGRIGKIIIFFRKPGAQPFEYYKITLADVLVTKMTDATADNAHVCQVQFSAGKFFWTYSTQSNNGGPGTPVSFGWNNETAAVWDGN